MSEPSLGCPEAFRAASRWVSLSANNRRHDGFQFDMRMRFCRRQLSPSHKKQQQMGSTRSRLVAKLICGRKV